MADEFDSRTGAEAATARATGVTLYRPIIVSILYLLTMLTGFTVLIGLILAYVWRNDEDVTEWEETHHTYLIRTFWIGFWVVFLAVATVIGTTVAASMNFQFPFHEGLDGMRYQPAVASLIFGAVALSFILSIWFIVRSILSLANAANRRPMPNPKTWLF